jgi:hypothetical protein
VVSSLISYIWIMVHAAFSLVFNISLELCLLGLSSFPSPFSLTLFGDFIPKGEKLEPKQAMCENWKRRSKMGKYDLGEVG